MSFSTITAVLQLFSMIGLGWMLANRLPSTIIPFTDEFWRVLGKFVYNVCVPVLMFSVLSQFEWHQEHLRFIAATLIGTILFCGLMFVVVPRLNTNTQSATIAAIACQPNSVFLGFPLVASVFAQQSELALGLAAIYSALEWPITTTFSVAILRRHKRDTRIEFRQFFKDPIILGCLIGFVWSSTGMEIPNAIQTPLTWVGGLTSTLALLIVGVRMKFGHIRQHLAAIFHTTAIKLLVLPLAGWIVAWMFGLTSITVAVFVLLIGTPVAVSTVLIVEQHKGDTELAAGAVTVSTLLSIVTLSVIASLFI